MPQQPSRLVGRPAMRRSAFGVLLLLATTPHFAAADIVQLREGGTVRGVIRDLPADDAETLVIETLTGAELRLASEEVVHIERRPLAVEHYETRANRVADTVEARWELAEWCQQAGLAESRREQLRRIVQLDPEHKAARQALGHKRQNNRWVDPEKLEAEWREAGYVKHKGEWITTLELEKLQANDKQTLQQKDWRPKIRLWVNWLSDRDPKRRAEAVIRLRELRDDNAIPAIVDVLLNSPSADKRALAVQTLAQMDGNAAAPFLARTAIGDPDGRLRQTAFRTMSATQRTAALPLFAQALTNEDNFLVRRAAVLLGEVGSKSAVPALIEALTTSHKTSIAVQQPVNGSFDRNGNPGTTSSPLPPEIDRALRAGQLPQGVQVHQSGVQPPVKLVTVRRPVQNKEVLDVLKKLTSQDFGFNEAAWRNWWRSQAR